MTDGSLVSASLLVSEYDSERRKNFVGLRPEDFENIKAVKDLVLEHVDEYVECFFKHLSGMEEAAGLFNALALLKEARVLKREHIIAMVGGNYGEAYVELRVKLGVLFGRARLAPPVFLGAFHALMQAIGMTIAEGLGDPRSAFVHFMSLEKVAFFDVGVIMDALIAERERTIRLQQDAIRELSTPALLLRDRLLILPIIGLLDSQRAKQLTEELLHAIRAHRATVVVMDITGVASIDSKVANHLIQTVAAASLMGARVIVTGLSADIAQAMVALGVDLHRLNTVGDLQGGLEEAERLLGYSVRLPNPSLAVAK